MFNAWIWRNAEIEKKIRFWCARVVSTIKPTNLNEYKTHKRKFLSLSGHFNKLKKQLLELFNFEKIHGDIFNIIIIWLIDWLGSTGWKY